MFIYFVVSNPKIRGNELRIKVYILWDPIGLSVEI